MNIQADPKFIVIDLFCGAGGVTTGFSQAIRDNRLLAYVVACINHDAKAIKSHWANHRAVEHFNEDITKLYGQIIAGVLFKANEFERLIRLVNLYRSFYPDAKVILWASLECTNFSKAKGGMSRDADSRTLAEHLQWYIRGVQPDYIQIENVVEFLDWGPLNKKGKPIKSKKGVYFKRWNRRVKAIGYLSQWVRMNSADFGAYTSRNRLFGIFSKHGLPVAFPEATHNKKGSGGMKKWSAVEDVLDFEDEGKNIFSRTTKTGKPDPLSENTLERLYHGLIKQVDNGKRTEFLSHYYSNGGDNSSITDPAPTIPTKARSALVTCTAYGMAPVGVFSGCSKHHYLVSMQFDNGFVCTDRPHPTLIARMDKKPPYLVTTNTGGPAIVIYEDDSPFTVLIKKFMAAFGIAEVKMRMLKVTELLDIQGFPKEYQLDGNQDDQKKFIGNSVVPLVVKLWTESLSVALEFSQADHRKIA